MKQHPLCTDCEQNSTVMDMPVPDGLKREWAALETRRRFLGRSGKVLGWAAMASLFGEAALRGDVPAGSGKHAMPAREDLKLPHFAPKAKRAIYLFMSGGPPQIDLLDYKPKLAAQFNKDMPDSVRGNQQLTGMTAGQSRFPIAPSHWPFKQYGQTGTWVSDLLPYTARMETAIPGLLAAGEAVGGANGANRLSGNAVTEALVFGRRAGRSAAERAARIDVQPFRQEAAREAIELATAGRDIERTDLPNSAELILSLQDTMADDVGSFRTGPKLERAITRIDRLARDLGERSFGERAPFDMQRIDWLDLRDMVLVARTVARAALRRAESRGAHQREDFPDTSSAWAKPQYVALATDGTLSVRLAR